MFRPCWTMSVGVQRFVRFGTIDLEARSPDRACASEDLAGPPLLPRGHVSLSINVTLSGPRSVQLLTPSA